MLHMSMSVRSAAGVTSSCIYGAKLHVTLPFNATIDHIIVVAIPIGSRHVPKCGHKIQQSGYQGLGLGDIPLTPIRIYPSLLSAYSPHSYQLQPLSKVLTGQAFAKGLQSAAAP